MPAVHAFPQSEATDPDNVADALDAGLLHWAKGETTQALSSLRQAIELSYEAGQEQRSLALTHTAADLARKNSPSATPLPPQNEVHTMDARRGRLPEPPSPMKKLGASAETTPSPLSPDNGSHSSPIPDPAGATQSTTAVPEQPLAARAASSATAASVRPIPPSARPAPANSAVPQSGTSGTRGIVSGDRVTESKPTPSAPQATAGTELPIPVPSKTEPSKTHLESTSVVPSKKHGPLSDSRSVSSEPRATSGSVVPNGVRDTRPSPRASSLDYRLASLRVRIDRVESDGTIRLKLLDLAATASGEDNALLIVPQLLWQELKHGG